MGIPKSSWCTGSFNPCMKGPRTNNSSSAIIHCPNLLQSILRNDSKIKHLTASYREIECEDHPSFFSHISQWMNWFQGKWYTGQYPEGCHGEIRVPTRLPTRLEVHLKLFCFEFLRRSCSFLSYYLSWENEEMRIPASNVTWSDHDLEVTKITNVIKTLIMDKRYLPFVIAKVRFKANICPEIVTCKV